MKKQALNKTTPEEITRNTDLVMGFYGKSKEIAGEIAVDYNIISNYYDISYYDFTQERIKQINREEHAKKVSRAALEQDKARLEELNNQINGL